MKGREHKFKSPHILHATRDKHQLERPVESNTHEGNRNGVKARKKLEHTQRTKAPPIWTQPIHRRWARVKGIRGCGLAVGRKRGSILGFPLKLF